MLEYCSYIIAVLSAYLLIAGKLYFLAPYRLGWLMLVANAIGEAIEIKVKVSRQSQDVIFTCLSVLCISAISGPWFGLAIGFVACLICFLALRTELDWRSEVPATQYSKLAGRVPLPIPRLIPVIRGPILTRGKKHYSLGTWSTGLTQDFELIILNPTVVRPQLPIRIQIESLNGHIEIKQSAPSERCPEPGHTLNHSFTVKAKIASGKTGVTVTVKHGDYQWKRRLVIKSIVDREDFLVRGCQIDRWKYGCTAGFIWRGDNDLYDPSTFQSQEGLRIALGLAARYRMPTTIMLSPRLSFNQNAHQQFCDKFGWDRRSNEIPKFIDFFHQEVDMANEQEFPTAKEKPFAAEIGNHMYLHYGTHAAAAPGNNWKSHAKMGDGNYPWMEKHPCSSLEEQRDNIKACTEATKQHLGVTTTCFTIPSDVYDSSTSAAVEAAGIEVGNDTDTNKIQKLLFFPKERHPEGCETLAEITRMIPKDIVNAAQVAMLKFWIGFSRRNRRALVYLAHHHMVMYQTNACLHLTAELLRSVLEDNEGDVHSATVTALGRYWRDVLSERTKKISIKISNNTAYVQNTADYEITGIPVEVSSNHGSFLRLVDIPAHSTIEISI